MSNLSQKLLARARKIVSSLLALIVFGLFVVFLIGMAFVSFEGIRNSSAQIATGLGGLAALVGLIANVSFNYIRNSDLGEDAKILNKRTSHLLTSTIDLAIAIFLFLILSSLPTFLNRISTQPITLDQILSTSGIIVGLYVAKALMICYFNMVYIANYVRLKFDSEPFNLDDCEGMLESALKKYLSPLLVFFEKKREGA